MTRIENIDIASPAFKANPYPFYARLRAEAPVFRVNLRDKRPAWLVTRYDDVAALLKDDRFIKERRRVMSPEQAAREPWIPASLRAMEKHMLDLDPPDHTRLRGLVHKAFTPQLIENLRDRVQTLTDQFLDAAQGRGHMDLIRDYALPLPTTIIAEMLGVPARERQKFQRWSNTIVTALPTTWGLFRVMPALFLFLRYIRKLTRARRGPRE